MGTLKTGVGRKLNLVFHKPNIIYITVPKAANSSIKHRLCKLYHDVDLDPRETHANNYGAHCDKQYMLENKDKYLIFSFVRNPWARAVSLYNNKIRVKGGGTKNIMQRHRQLRVGMSFEKFVHAMSEIDVSAVKPAETATELHLRSQTSWLYLGDNLLPRFVGRVENIDEDWEKVCLSAGLQYSPMTHKNKSTPIKDTYQEYYTPELVDIIGEVYKKDIENFGYEFE